MRRFLLAATAVLATSDTASAQLEFGLNGGIHFDRTGQAHRVITESPNTEIYSARGEAPAIGVRTTYWFKPRLGIGGGITASENRSWFGGGSEPLPEMAKRTIFASAAAEWRAFAPESRFQLQVGLGPAVVVHTGSGESLLARQTDLGIIASAAPHIRIGRGLRVGLDLQNYRFKTDFRLAFTRDGRPVSSGGVVRRSEWIVLPTIRWTH